MGKYKNKYRIESHRMPYWDYSNNGYYFITIVTRGRVCNLGEINNETITLSDFGKIVETEWCKSFEIRNELFLDCHIIMPNHIHAIVVLEKNNEILNNSNDTIGDDDYDFVDTHGRVYLQNHESNNQSFIRKPKSISSFIAGFKSAVNSKIDDYIDEYNLKIPKYNRNNHFFQPNYYDHIIRNNSEYQRITKYINNNPFNWEKDKLHEHNKRKHI